MLAGDKIVPAQIDYSNSDEIVMENHQDLEINQVKCLLQILSQTFGTQGIPSLLQRIQHYLKTNHKIKFLNKILFAFLYVKGLATYFF